jgi:hypothetical protein
MSGSNSAFENILGGFTAPVIVPKYKEIPGFTTP